MKARLEPRINLQGRTALETVIPLATPFIDLIAERGRTLARQRGRLSMKQRSRMAARQYA